MGFSTVYGNIIVLATFIILLSTLYTVYSDNMSDTGSAVKAQGSFLAERLGTSIGISEIATTTSDNDVSFYVVNDGGTTLDVNCTDFFIDREWIKRSEMAELVLTNVTFDPGVWNPGETLKMRVDYDTDHGAPHEGKVVTCNGVSASVIFQWAS